MYSVFATSPSPFDGLFFERFDQITQEKSNDETNNSYYRACPGGVSHCLRAKQSKADEQYSRDPRQMTIDWEEAYKNFDDAALERILADDWVGIGDDGNKHPKAQSIANIKSRRYVIKS